MKKRFMLLTVLLLGMLIVVGCVEETVKQNEHHHDEEGIIFEIIYRSADEVTAYIHVDHWHGGLPVIQKGENISLGAYVEKNEVVIELDGKHYDLRVDYARDADENIVSFDNHGDHVHIIGEQEGQTDVVFQLFHDNKIEYETPPISVNVVKDDD
ncbi:hypothetical protein SYNTR_1426 [Candidatus Syntrophocurvum alkaliphilum]|uniref:Lipoprotein n=1 Tax=Candidatus Syntrophocurvum alkaliphilum TaxID=2293317 RepID=A0A6I6DCR7_9FIRM|nr:hypothetical protein [Candidatus Syntrophocurvum alkaliphilum]QGU00020.1 hypothetical protein SYNTR_1426 [Candidatus Syntrophocurvum alkaliphilum]